MDLTHDERWSLASVLKLMLYVFGADGRWVVGDDGVEDVGSLSVGKAARS